MKPALCLRLAGLALLALGAAALSGCVIEDTGDPGDVRRFDVFRPDGADLTPPPSDTTPQPDGRDLTPPPDMPPPPDTTEPVDVGRDTRPPPPDTTSDTCFDCPPPSGCTPSWDPADPGVGCPAGQYCLPDQHVADLAYCVPSNPNGVPEGGFCSDTGQCRTGLFCLDLVLEPNVPPERTCARACNPTAPAGSAGWCEWYDGGPMRACVPVWNSDTGEVLAVGLCADACRLDALETFWCAPAPDRNYGCQVGRLFGLTGGVDLCVPIPDAPLSEGADCAASGLPEFEFCKENGLCIDLYGDGSPDCTEFCSIDRAPLGTTGHPDCTDPNRTCDDVFAIPEFGVCR